MPLKTPQQFASRIGEMSNTLRPTAQALPGSGPAISEEAAAALELQGQVVALGDEIRELKAARQSHSDVFIATPLNWDHLYKRHMACIEVMHKHGAMYRQIDGDAIDEMRNIGVEKAREAGAKHILFLDADMTPPPETLERLLSHDKPIVSGLCRQRKSPHAMCVWRINDDGWCEFEEPKGLGLHECGATGGACLLINMEVFDAIDEQLEHLKGRYFLDARQIPGLKPQEQISEDLFFCAAARAVGYTVHVDLDLRIGHLIMGEVIDSGAVNSDKHIPEHSAIWRLE